MKALPVGTGFISISSSKLWAFGAVIGVLLKGVGGLDDPCLLAFLSMLRWGVRDSEGFWVGVFDPLSAFVHVIFIL